MGAGHVGTFPKCVIELSLENRFHYMSDMITSVYICLILTHYHSILQALGILGSYNSTVEPGWSGDMITSVYICSNFYTHYRTRLWARSVLGSYNSTVKLICTGDMITSVYICSSVLVIWLHLCIFAGSQNKQVMDSGHNNCSMYGQGKKYQRSDIERLFRQLVVDAILDEDLHITAAGTYTTLSLYGPTYFSHCTIILQC